jgi:plasmid maintenance system antidote protein VapI
MTLRDWMAREGISLTDLAKALGRPVPTVHAWVHGHRTPRGDALLDIKRATGGAVTADALIAQRADHAAAVAETANHDAAREAAR